MGISSSRNPAFSEHHIARSRGTISDTEQIHKNTSNLSRNSHRGSFRNRGPEIVSFSGHMMDMFSIIMSKGGPASKSI